MEEITAFLSYEYAIWLPTIKDFIVRQKYGNSLINKPKEIEDAFQNFQIQLSWQRRGPATTVSTLVKNISLRIIFCWSWQTNAFQNINSPANL